MNSSLKKMARRALLFLALICCQQMPAQEWPSPGMNFYGWTMVVNFMFFSFPINFPGTYPFYKNNSTTVITGIPGPAMYPISTSSWHNATMYGAALTGSNAVRGSNLLMEKAEAKKELAAPLTGKGPASLSFWEWVKAGQMGLEIAKKTHNIILALQAGDLNIDLYKLMPKIGVINEDDPSAPALVLGLAPESRNAFLQAKNLMNFSDPRFYLGNKISYNELETMVPSLATTPSFFEAYAHYNKTTSTNQLMLAKLQRNFHEVRTSLSLLSRNLAGSSSNYDEAVRSRMSPSKVQMMLQTLLARRNTYWNAALLETRRGLNLLTPGMGDTFATNASPAWNGAGSTETKMLQDMQNRRTSDIWAAKQAASVMWNTVGVLETEEYGQQVNKVNDLITTYVSDKTNIVMGDEQKFTLGVEVADAWVNKLIEDELKAMRQIYTLRAKREEREILAPYLLKSYTELQVAADRLDRLNRMLYVQQRGQQASTQVFTASDMKDMVQKTVDQMALP